MKKTITTIILAMVLTLGTTFANAGIIVVGRGESPDTKTLRCDMTTKSETGIIVVGLAEIIAEFTGIIVVGRADSSTGTPCTQPTTGSKDGIIVVG